MRRRSTTTCRSSGLARGIALGAGALALAGFAVPAAAQVGGFGPDPYPRLWVAQESINSHADAHDEGVEILYWKEVESGQPDEHWIYVAGWVTEMDGGQVKGTRFATFKYDATFFDNWAPPLPTAKAFFPPYDPGQPGHVDLVQGDSYKAVGMAIDELTGDIYVAGQGPDQPGGTDQDYIVVKYDKDLNPVWTPPARYYDGPVSGDDIPADILFDEATGDKLIVVTGTSPGNGTGLDIATVAWHDTGDWAGDHWPDDGWGDGRRRYNGSEDGDDRAAALGRLVLAEPQGGQLLQIVVLGTTYAGATRGDDYTTHVWGGVDGVLLWNNLYDNGGDDVGRALWVEGAYIWSTGYSDGATDIDIATIAYLENGDELWTPAAVRWDYLGNDDFPCDIFVFATGGGPGVPSGGAHIWITGAGSTTPGADAALIYYEHDWTQAVTLKWDTGWSHDDWQFGRAITYFNGPYITGAWGASTEEAMMIANYESAASPPPLFDLRWNRSYSGSGFHEGRGIAVAGVDGTSELSVFVVGVTTQSGEGRQFATWRYREED